MLNPFERKQGESWGWLWQAVTGVLLVLLVGLHLIANHFVVQGGLRTYADVVAYLRMPLILVLELAFLGVVTTHALLGVRSILFDLGLSDRLERLVTRGLTVVGVLTVVYGVWLTWVIIR